MPAAPGIGRWFRPVLWVVLLGAGHAWGQLPPPAPALARSVYGRAVYEKIPVTPMGPDLSALADEPIRDARVVLLDPSSGVVGRTRTDLEGRFHFEADAGEEYRVRVEATLVGEAMSVFDNSRGGVIWSVTTALAAGDDALLVRASEATRAAGAFNILETLRRARAFVQTLEPDLSFPELSVYWSPLNTNDATATEGVFVGGTWFDPTGNRAIVLGDRHHDSDEFDDDVILHEYAHYLAARFSSDDSPGGPHGPGDVLDPRVAWSEGWADFFPALIDQVPSYVDSHDWFGDDVVVYDLESNQPGRELPGYWSERSVRALLWDLADRAEDAGEMVDVAPAAIWRAFRALSGERFVYLPSFLKALVEIGGATASEVEQLARIHFLDFSTREDATSRSFPRFLNGDVATGELDSWSDQRTNLARSSHLYGFRTSGGAVAIELQVTGLGAARNPKANDLDLVLMDGSGRVLGASRRGGDGGSERIATFLPAGDYVIEVGSFSSGADGIPRKFNSGTYRLTLNRP